jgi:hypothetical protein
MGDLTLEAGVTRGPHLYVFQGPHHHYGLGWGRGGEGGVYIPSLAS